MKDFPVLETERLHLVNICPCYTKDLYDILSRDNVTRYYGVDSLESIDEAAELVEQIQTLFRQGRSIRWGLVLKETGQFIGTAGLNNIHYWNKKADIGYELHPDFWRKGFMSEAVCCILEYAFEVMELYRIGAVTYPENIPSIRLLKKLSFQQEGILRGYLQQSGRSHDVIMHSLLKPEWGKLNHQTGEEKLFPVQQREKKLYQLTTIPYLPHSTILAKEIKVLKKEIHQLKGRERRKKEKLLKKKLKMYQQICPHSLKDRLIK